MSKAMVTNGLCILTIIAIFHALIQSDHPENFLGVGGGLGRPCSFAFANPAQGCVQQSLTIAKSIPLESEAVWTPSPTLDLCKSLIGLERESIFLCTFSFPLFRGFCLEGDSWIGLHTPGPWILI